jgi:hypothetical protein
MEEFFLCNPRKIGYAEYDYKILKAETRT